MTPVRRAEAAFIDSLSPLATRRLVLFGGKGGVGKTTLAVAAALAFSRSRGTILFTTDPASNLTDLFGASSPPGLRIESIQAEARYEQFLAANLDAFLEIGDRGTYLDREELKRLLELSLPGVDELMAWMRIGELVEEGDGVVVVDTAPTGHTLRMLSSSGHFEQLVRALDAMQEKHRAMVRQFTRRPVRDPLDAFIDDFEATSKRRSELLADPSRAAFVPVTLSEPLVIEQTLRLIDELGIDVPLVVLNRAVSDPDCARDEARAQQDALARQRFAPREVIDAPRACKPLDTAERIGEWSGTPAGRARRAHRGPSAAEGSGERALPAGSVTPVSVPRLLFLAGKGGVGKTTSAASIALNLAAENPERRYVVISVDPAHSLRDLFAAEAPPANLEVETIDTKEKWRRLRDSLGREIAGAMEALTPRGMSIAHDAEAMEELIAIAPPGADELFAINRLADLVGDESVAGIVVDTAPTGHFLRLLDLPAQAGEWLREFMRLLLRYRELIPAGSLGEELVRASRALRDLDAALHSPRAAVLVVTRPERIVVEETRRLISHLEQRSVVVGGVIANYVTPENDCRCDRSMRDHELEALAVFPDPIVIERRAAPPGTLAEIASLLRGLKMQP